MGERHRPWQWVFRGGATEHWRPSCFIGDCPRAQGRTRALRPPFPPPQVRGFWAGDHCEVCSDAYLAPLCRALNVAISRPREMAALTQAPGAGARSAMVSDAEHHLLYTGGQPLLVLDPTTNDIVAAFFLAGLIRSAGGWRGGGGGGGQGKGHMVDGRDTARRSRAPGPHAHGNAERQVMDGLRTEVCGK